MKTSMMIIRRWVNIMRQKWKEYKIPTSDTQGQELDIIDFDHSPFIPWLNQDKSVDA
jgi:hypothetical protein